MKELLHIIQNDPEVPPGTITDHLTIPYVVHHPYCNGFLPEKCQISALVVLGGAMGANDDGRYPFLSDLKNLIRTTVAAGTPYLGICLGGQLLAAALGAEVASNRWEEVGTLTVSLTEEGTADRLFKGIPERFGTFQWHHDSFELPDGGILLASSSACPHQAFRVGETAWGLQFHPEVMEDSIRDWCAWDSSSQDETEELISAFSSAADSYGATARRLFHNFLGIAGMKHVDGI